jgi:hypothetical protein
MKFDTDNSGDIDLKEFMAGLYPKAANSSTAWNENMRKGHDDERILNKPKQPKLAQGQWTGTVEDVERQLQSIISQRLDAYIVGEPSQLIPKLKRCCFVVSKQDIQRRRQNSTGIQAFHLSFVHHTCGIRAQDPHPHGGADTQEPV